MTDSTVASKQVVPGQRFIENIVEQLIDTTRRNPSLNYRPAKAAIVLSCTAQTLDNALPLQAKMSIAELIGSAPTTDQLKTLRSLSERSRLLAEERGVHVLRVAAGFIHWDDKLAGKSYNAPVLFVEVELSKSGDAYFLTRSEGSDLEPNREFFELLRRHPACRSKESRTTDPISFADAVEALREALPTGANIDVSSECHLGLFSYEKLVMVHDIEDNADDILEHPLIAALNGDPEPLALSQHGIESPTPPELDQATASGERVFIYEADSTQQEALEGIARGLSLVIQGPPGTGKSQTIVNVIAQALFDGKSVLFVAEKKVALDVVQDRLDRQGLGDAVLAVQRDADKKRFALSLGSRHAELAALGSPSAVFKNTAGAIAELDAYRTELHQPILETQQTPYRLYGRASKHVADAMPVRITNIEHLSAESRDVLGELIERLATYPSWLRSPDEAAWSSLRPEVQNLDIIHRSLDDMVIAKEASEEAAAIVHKSLLLLGDLHTGESGSLSEIQEWLAILGSSPTIPETWLSSEPQKAIESLKQFENDRQQYDSTRVRLGSRYKPTVFDLDLDELAEKFLADYQHFWKRWFNKSYSSDSMTVLEQRLAEHRQAVYGELRDELLSLRQVKKQRTAWSSNDHDMRVQFSHLFSGPTTDIAALQAAVEWHQVFCKKRASSTPVNTVLVTSLTSSDPSIRAGAASLSTRLSEMIKKLETSVSQLESVFIDIPVDRLTLASYFGHKIDQIEEAPRYCQFRKWIAEVKSLGCSRLLDRIRDDASLEPDKWRSIFDQVFDASLIDYVHRTRPALAAFDRSTHERLRERFASLDEENVTTGGKRVASRVVSIARAKMTGEEYTNAANVIAKEASKSRNLMTIRTLTRSAFPAIQVLKPCWMMSPLAVSQYLPPGKVFDIVVFDEASQMRPADAIAAVSRGKQVVVVGDNKQLPPTSFFDSAMSEADGEQEDDKEGISDYESILDRCSAVLQQRMLRWHYRSRDESLIAFSNREFYDRRLVTFPTPLKQAGVGVRFVKVEGTYSRGGSRQNRGEAQEVARLAFEHAKTRPNETLGIITFSQAQQHAIEDALEKAGEDDPTNRAFFSESRPTAERVFVKNLESVQGDERDVIILSVGYGKDVDGRLSYNFGPLNRSGGGRRLNVAVTRAKSEMIVVSSIDDHDLDASKCSEGGPKLVRLYLEYARLGGSLQGVTTYTGRGVDSPFEEDARLVLSSAGHKVHLQVGASGYRIDLAVCHPQRPGEYVLAVECDGATYHSSPTARDRDRLRDRTLKAFGWKVHRIWSRDWFRRRNEEIERLFAAVEEAYVHADSVAPTKVELRIPDSRPEITAERDDKALMLNAANVAVFGFLERTARDCTKKEVAEGTALPEVLVNTALQSLIDQGFVSKTGVGRGTKYAMGRRNE
jgi:very-short-patch-repair endonuclease